MKRKSRVLIGTIISAMAFTGIAVLTIPNADPRKDYEKFLVSAYRELPSIHEKETGESGDQMDSPELAGIREYFMTLDPSLRLVPTERRYPSYQKTLSEKVNSLKSGANLPEWATVPANQGGRTRALMFDPNDPTHSKVWAGSVTGGLWYNEDPIGGMPWIAVESFWPSLSISSITFDPNNKNIFYVGTGESQTSVTIYRESTGRGAGIFKTTDGGSSWSLLESTKQFAYVNNILVRNENGLSILYATIASGLYSAKYHQSLPSDGLYRSADGGTTWQQVLPLIPGDDQPYSPSDLDLGADNRLYVGTIYNKNKNGGGCILMSDNGIDWTVYSGHREIILTEQKNFPGRVIISASKSDPNVIYAALAGGFINTRGYGPFGIDNLMHFNGTHFIKSTDRGLTWTDITLPGSPEGWSYIAWHALEITADPINPNIIWAGALDLYRSIDGGLTWSRMSNWGFMYSGPSPLYVHADIHNILYQPGGNATFLVGTDGGIFGTKSATAQAPVFFELAHDYNTLQAYSCAIHPEKGARHYLAGLQDNGTNFFGTREATFQSILSGGDGAFCFIDENEPTFQITSVYNSNYSVYTGDKEVKPAGLYSTGTDRGLFINPSDYDYKKNVIWGNRMDPDGNRKDYIFKMRIAQGLPTTDILVGSGTIVPFSCVKIAPSTNTVSTNLYLGTESGLFLKILNADATFTRENLTGSSFPKGFISSIDVTPAEDTILVTFSNYGVESIWLSTDKGKTWSGKEGNLPDMPVRWSLIHPKNSKQVMIATETGVWLTNNITENPVVWLPASAGMGYVRCDMLKFRKSDNTVLVASHGKGLYTALWTPTFINSTIEEVEEVEKVEIFPNPTQGRFEIDFPAKSAAQITITDLTGRVVTRELLQSQNGVVRKSFDLSRETKGTYVLRLERDGKSTSKRIIVQ